MNEVSFRKALRFDSYGCDNSSSLSNIQWRVASRAMRAFIQEERGSRSVAFSAARASDLICGSFMKSKFVMFRVLPRRHGVGGSRKGTLQYLLTFHEAVKLESVA